EHLTKEILKEFLAGYGKVPDKEKEKKRLGMAQKEYAIGIVSDYDLPITPDQYVQAVMPFYHDLWLQAKALPGANRLIRHLHKHGVPFALASNSKRKNIDGKVSLQEGWKECFSVILGSDQVKSGKPSPDIFLEAAKQMGADAAHCLVIEDSVIGVRAGKAAGMKVVAVPSFHSEFDQYTIADSVLRSLLDLKPEVWGLPPFEDYDGPSTLPDQVFGVYFGWAKPEAYKFIKIVLGNGWGHGCCSSKRKMVSKLTQCFFTSHCWITHGSLSIMVAYLFSVRDIAEYFVYPYTYYNCYKVFIAALLNVSVQWTTGIYSLTCCLLSIK
uniref:2-deoxyglucose-6-phosphate phosphatase n=1 Tax=Solanum tuberosum TaxID=4113 RepID=M1BTP7_SOLTU